MITDQDFEKMKQIFATKEEVASIKVEFILLYKQSENVESQITYTKKQIQEGFSGIMQFLGEIHTDLKKELNTSSGKVKILEKAVWSLKPYNTMTENHEERIIKIENQLAS